MKYHVTLNGERFVVDLDGDHARVDGGAERPAHLTALAGTPVRLVTIGAETRDVHRVIARRERVRGRYVLRVDGRRYQAEALDERAYAIRELESAVPRDVGPQPLLAPMPGLVLRVRVAPGDRVVTGQPIVVIEAMKMENELRSPSSGVVRSVAARVGSAVEKGAILVEIADGGTPAEQGSGSETKHPERPPVDTP